METFDIPVIRTASRTKIISVQATSLKEAQSLALDEAGDHDFPSEKESFYQVQDCPQLEREIIATGASAFTSGNDPYSEYQKLVEANDNGGESDFACDRANISEPYDNYLVEELLSVINDHISVVRALTQRVNGV